jgi:hypothetical protein
LGSFLPGRSILQAKLFHCGLEFPQFLFAHDFVLQREPVRLCS